MHPDRSTLSKKDLCFGNDRTLLGFARSIHPLAIAGRACLVMCRARSLNFGGKSNRGGGSGLGPRLEDGGAGWRCPQTIAHGKISVSSAF